jgi:hypothetical protein
VGATGIETRCRVLEEDLAATIGGMATSSRKAARVTRYALYGCTTDDGDEEWFVVAASATAARRFHEQAEGYARDDADAELVITLPVGLVDERGWQDPDDGRWSREAGWPSDALLSACGGEIAMLPGDDLRDQVRVLCKVVRFGDRTFRAGDPVSNALRELGFHEPARLAVFRGERNDGS